MSGAWRGAGGGEFWREVWRGKTPARILMNFAIRQRVQLRGRVADLGGGKNPSYWRFLDASGVELVRVDLPGVGRPDVAASLEVCLPFAANVFDAVLLFNVLEHVYAADQLLAEICRVLRPGGTLYLFVPFLAQVHPDPEDYRRYTGLALARMFEGVGFSFWEIAPVGEACQSVVAAAYPLLFARPLRLLALMAARLGDALLCRWGETRPEWNFRHWVIGYFASVCK